MLDLLLSLPTLPSKHHFWPGSYSKLTSALFAALFRPEHRPVAQDILEKWEHPGSFRSPWHAERVIPGCAIVHLALLRTDCLLPHCLLDL